MKQQNGFIDVNTALLVVGAVLVIGGLAFDATGSRELSLAKTKVEEAVMWATKHLTR